MTVFVALLRSVNVGGTGMLPMQELRGLCAGLGFDAVRTFIQSGNVVFESALDAGAVQARLEQALQVMMGRAVGVLVRTGPALRAVLEGNPYRNAEPAKVGVLFLPELLPENALILPPVPAREEIHLARREIYVHYPDGMGRSKLKLPAASYGTMRNLNTIEKLVALTSST